MSEPVRVVIPRIGVDAQLEALRVREGVLQGPRDFQRAGWWSDGPEPGEPGAAVVAGHVDSRSGPAVFWRLRELRAGDAVTIVTSAGDVRFRVIGLERHPKQRLPVARVFGRTPHPTLRLITCGGPFLESRRSYRDNVIVYAEPERV